MIVDMQLRVFGSADLVTFSVEMANSDSLRSQVLRSRMITSLSRMIS